MKEEEEEKFSDDVELSFNISDETMQNLKETLGINELEQIHKRFENGIETIEDIMYHCLNYKVDLENGKQLMLVETKYLEKLVKYIEKQQEEIEQLKKENTNLKQIQELGLNKEKQYCFNEDGHTGKCLGYSNFNDDEPCNYCKACERLNKEEGKQ